MAGRIPSQFIDELLSRVDIVDVIDSRVALKKAGREYHACCPFHNEKTPSFTVSPGKQFYHCFGCGAHGSAVSFLMEYEHMEFVDAIEELASIAGITVPREASQPHHKESRGLFELMEQVAKYYRDQLRQHEKAEQAIAYLKQRGLSGEIAATFGIGYAPPGWDNVLKHFTGKGVGEKQLLDAGLLIEKQNGGYYDRFRDRIMFPINDRRGRVIGFGGRALGDETPKYLNSPETELFHKGRELYGLYEARKHSKTLERLIVVEGYIDVVSLSQYGVKNVVATLGTATTADHLDKLFRIVPEVIFCFDGDRAGRQAAWRAVETALPQMREGRQIKFIFLPEGEDPDTIVRTEGEAGFLKRVKNAEAFSNFFFQSLSNKIELNTLDGRSFLVEKARPYLARLPDSVFQHMMVNKLAEISQVDSDKLSTLIYSASKPILKKQRDSVKPSGGPSPVRQLIRLLLEMPGLSEKVDIKQFEGLDLPGVPLFIELVETIRLNPHMNYAGILERWRGTDNGKHLAKLAQQSITLDDEGIQSEFFDALQWLVKQQRSQRAEQLLAKSKLGTITDEEKKELNKVLSTRL
jgi:DNA primase